MNKATDGALIRPICNSDHAGVLRINVESRPAVAAMDGAELGRLLALGGTHLVAVGSDRTVLGYLLAFAKSDPYEGEEFRYFAAQIAQPFLYVDQIAILRRAHRQGIGRKLYRSLTEHAVACGIGVLCCEVNTSPANEISLEFHTRLGFSQIGTLNLLDRRSVALLVSASELAQAQSL
jgi:predicted GNAT superfamily acetyltransferase